MPSVSIPPTVLSYLKDTECVTGEASIINVEASSEGGGVTVVLNDTLFHPQGGGQPSDRGTIRGVDFELLVEGVSMDKSSGVVAHLCKKVQGEPQCAPVHLSVDADVRQTHARLHSGGHLLDVAVKECGFDWTPSKGYHFPEGPYVEYLLSDSSGEFGEATVAKLNEAVARLVEADGPVHTKLEEALWNKERKVEMGGVECPCGGTHVKRIGQLKGLTVRAAKKKKKTVRVSYKFDGPVAP